MPRVLLKRPFQTPVERYPRAEDGEPCFIPQQVIDKHGLPPDAEVVDEDYVPPAQRPAEDDQPAEVVAANMEAEIQKRVEEELAKRDAAARAEKVAEEADEEETGGEAEDVLKLSVAEITERLEELDADELEALLAREQAGKNRKGVITSIQAALEDFED